MASTLDLDDTVLTQASEWYVLTLGDDIGDADLEALEAWLAADPRHARAFDLTARTALQLNEGALFARLKALDAVEDPASATLSAANDAHDPLAHLAPSRRTVSRRALVWGGATALAASLALAIGLDMFTAAPAGPPVTTAIAETRVLQLADGSRVTLGPASRIATRIDGNARNVTLLAGEAFFEVAHDRTRPFHVEAGDARIEVVGTKFDVSRSGGRVHVSVLEGVVKVREAAPLFAAASIQTLTAGKGMETAEAPASFFSAAPPAPIAAEHVPAGEWRSGRRTYIDARLGDVVADLNRYYAPGVTLADPSLGDVRIAMELRPGDTDAFFGALPLVAPVRIARSASGTVRVERAR
jgi:transmembrane sensor